MGDSVAHPVPSLCPNSASILPSYSGNIADYIRLPALYLQRELVAADGKKLE